MTTQPNRIIAEAIIEKLNKVNQEAKAADAAYDALLVARDKNRADLEANDVVRLSLAEQRDALHEHLAIVAPPLSDEEIAALENTPGVIE